MKKLIIIPVLLAITLLISCLTTTSSETATDNSVQKTSSVKPSKPQETVQVVPPSVENLSGTESAWLPGQIQDKLKSNMQEYLGLRTVVDSNAEKNLKKLQAESESGARDENTAIELGKITTAKYGLFSKIRKTSYGYSITVDYTDLTMGVQVASATSKEYSKAEYLYGSTGAVDEVTLALANKLDIKLNNQTKNLLATGSAGFSVDDQLALAKQNEEQYQKLMRQYDEDLKKLSVSNDLSAIENKKKIEAEKALLAEKQKSEQKRLAELAAQKQQAESDAKLEAERSIELKTQRDNLAKQAAAKAEQVRQLKLEKQGVLGQINVIESKKKALAEIRQAVEARCVELFEQMKKDKKTEEDKIRNAPWSSVELNNGQPTEAAKQRRENKVAVSNDSLQNKFFADCENVQKSASWQDSALLSEIRTDQKALEKTRTVSSMSDELKVNFGLYDGSRNGWLSYINLYTEGVLLYSDIFILKYESISGKKAPDLATEMNDAVIQEYANTVDMYNSLLTRGDPILYFELDYTVMAEDDNKPSQYTFNFNKIRAINTISGKTVQTSAFSKTQDRVMTPSYDLREFMGIVTKEKARKYKVEKYMAERSISETDAMKLIMKEQELEIKYKEFGITMVPITGRNFEMLSTEVTQKLYRAVRHTNPSYFKGDNRPVEGVSWYDAVNFCNALSKKLGLNQVYTINGYNVTQVFGADGFRLPTLEECQYTGMGGGVWKWCWDYYPGSIGARFVCGGVNRGAVHCGLGDSYWEYADSRNNNIGLRPVRTIK